MAFDIKNLNGQMFNGNFADRLAGLGSALGALSQGQVADLSSFRQSIEARGAQDKLMNNQELLAKFTPEQRAMLATLPPAAAQQLIAETVFAPSANDAARMAELKSSPLWSKLSPDQQAALEVMAPDQASAVLSELAFKSQEPVKGVAVGGNIVNPIDGSIIYQGQAEASHRVLSADEVASMGLPPGAYQQAPDGKITSISGTGGPTINVSTGGQGENILKIDEKTGRALIADPAVDGGMRWVDIPGGTASKEADKTSAQSGVILSTINDLLADPGLDQAVGMAGAVTGYLGPLAPDAARARSRIDQIKGQTFLQAFESLKGGGQITEIEGKKAEAAIARMNTEQSPADFRAALTEFRDIVQTALDRAQGGQQTQQTQPGAAPQASKDLSDDDLIKLYSGGQ